jgi:hypothetical protein
MFFIYGGYDGAIEKEINMSAKNKWLLGAGIILGLIVLFALPFVWQALIHPQGFGMMGYYGRTPMMYGNGFSPMHSGIGFGMGFGMFFLWLIPLGLIILIGLGIAALIKYLRNNSTE